MNLKVGVVGAGYVGLTTAVCLAAKGADTFCMDNDAGRLAELRSGRAGIDEPGLDELLCSGVELGTLRFTRHCRRLGDRDVVFICVPTPANDGGSTDLKAVENAVGELAQSLRPDAVIAVKSTVPVGTSRRLSQMLAGRGIHTVVNPEFLRESHAVHDFCHPERVVIGAVADGDEAAERVASLCADQAVLRMSLESAELAEYASNAFLAVKLSFVNSMAELCARVGADIRDITGCMGADERIGHHFLAPGPGWGGSCLPRRGQGCRAGTDFQGGDQRYPGFAGRGHLQGSSRRRLPGDRLRPPPGQPRRGTITGRHRSGPLRCRQGRRRDPGADRVAGIRRAGLGLHRAVRGPGRGRDRHPQHPRPRGRHGVAAGVPRQRHRGRLLTRATRPSGRLPGRAAWP